jgi:peptide chain release factor 2
LPHITESRNPPCPSSKKSASASPSPATNSGTSWSVFDLAAQEERLKGLEAQSADPALWNSPDNARKLMQDLSRQREQVEKWHAVRARVHDALELAALGDESMLAELAKETDAVEVEVARLDLEALLSGPHDAGDAFLSIHAGAGGTDSQDWAAMLERMFLRWTERRGYATEVLDRMEGEEAGIKSVTISVRGANAYGWLRSEKGVHRLVRLSPFDSANRRHTSFALVEVYPQLEQSEEVDIPPADLKIETYRSSGAGGQNVQKNETAVRITHLPTGIVVTCQNERSQTQNRENAMRVLRARLKDLLQEAQEKELAALKGEHVKAEWGSQIRSYVLHPYQMVKDHRTEHETGNTGAVLNGELDEFMESFLRSTLGEAAGA